MGGIFGGSSDGPAPSGIGLASALAGGLDKMERMQKEDRQFGIQEGTLAVHQAASKRAQEQWDMERKKYTEDKEHSDKLWTSLGEAYATGELRPGGELSNIYQRGKADMNGDGTPDKEEETPDGRGKMSASSPLGLGSIGGAPRKAAAGKSKRDPSRLLLDGMPEALERGQSLAKEGQDWIQKISARIKETAGKDPRLAVSLASSPQYKENIQRAEFMVRHGNELISSHFAAKNQRAVQQGVLALMNQDFDVAQDVFKTVGIHVPDIKRSRPDAESGLMMIEFKDGKKASIPLFNLIAQVSPDISSQDQTKLFGDTIAAITHGKQTAAGERNSRRSAAGGDTSEMKNFAKLSQLQSRIDNARSPEEKEFAQRTYDTFSRMPGVAGKSGKERPAWSADDERMADRFDEIIKTPDNYSPEQVAEARRGLAELTGRLGVKDRAIRREGQSDTPSFGVEGQSDTPSWGEDAPGAPSIGGRQPVRPQEGDIINRQTGEIRRKVNGTWQSLGFSR